MESYPPREELASSYNILFSWGRIFFHRVWGGGLFLSKDYVFRKDDVGQDGF
jgi:hypothetical protein